MYLCTLYIQFIIQMKRIFQRELVLSILILGLSFHLAAQSTLMTIHMNDGTERIYNMSENDRAYFEDDDKLVIDITISAKSDRFNLADIRKITCNSIEGVPEETNAPLWLSPNPVHDAFLIHNLIDEQSISIYTLDGRIVKSLESTGEQKIDISDLPIGLYLVKTEHQTFKMIKL